MCACVLIAGLFSRSEACLGQANDLLLMQRGPTAGGTASGIVTSNQGETFFSSRPILIVSFPAASRKVWPSKEDSPRREEKSGRQKEGTWGRAEQLSKEEGSSSAITVTGSAGRFSTNQERQGQEKVSGCHPRPFVGFITVWEVVFSFLLHVCICFSSLPDWKLGFYQPDQIKYFFLKGGPGTWS